jgi:UDP-N-acetylmuramate--alanine ligase
VIVTDIFAAGEQPEPGVTGRLVADAVVAENPELDVAYIAGRAELRAHLAGVLRSGDLCLTLGAGDLTTLPDEMVAAWPW